MPATSPVTLDDIVPNMTFAMLRTLRTMVQNKVHLRRVVGKDAWAFYEVHGIEMKDLGRVRERTVTRLQSRLLVTKGYDTGTITSFGRQVVDKAYS